MSRRGRTAPPPLNEKTMEPIPKNPVVPLDDDPEFPDPCHELNFQFNSDLTPMFTPHFPMPTLLHTHSDLTLMLLRIFPHQPRSILLRRFRRFPIF